MRFSLILASRGRPDLLEKLITSVGKNTVDQDSIELLIGIDEDDEATAERCKTCREKYTWVRPFVRNRGSNIARDYHNWLLKVARGQYLFVLNDDVQVETYGWDAIADLKFRMVHEKHKGLTYGQTSPACGNGYSEFPMVTRAGAEALGFLMPEDFPCWGADSGLFGIYNERGLVQNIKDVRLSHARVSDTTRNQLSHFKDGTPRKPVASIAEGLVARPEPVLRWL